MSETRVTTYGGITFDERLINAVKSGVLARNEGIAASPKVILPTLFHAYSGRSVDSLESMYPIIGSVAFQVWRDRADIIRPGVGAEAQDV